MNAAGGLEEQLQVFEWAVVDEGEEMLKERRVSSPLMKTKENILPVQTLSKCRGPPGFRETWGRHFGLGYGGSTSHVL